MRFFIHDDDALAFSRTFYGDLAQGIPIEGALWQARLSLRKSERAWAIGVPVLDSALDLPARTPAPDTVLCISRRGSLLDKCILRYRINIERSWHVSLNRSALTSVTSTHGWRNTIHITDQTNAFKSPDDITGEIELPPM
jgi:hypothetical protein